MKQLSAWILAAAFGLAGHAAAEEAAKTASVDTIKLPEPSQVRQMKMHPGSAIKLVGSDDSPSSSSPASSTAGLCRI